MSRRAIAALLAREDLASGERLVAFSLASFADRQNRAWPGAPAAAQRAGLSRSRYLQARDRLVRDGLVVVEDAASGRGRSTTLGLVFAAAGPWWDGEVNAELCEAVLSYSRTRGPARLLLAAMAALASESGAVEDLTTERLCRAAGLADRTYRRARHELLASGELNLISGAGGRGNTNRWEIPEPRLIANDGRGPVAAPRVAPPANAWPLIGVAADQGASTSQTQSDGAAARALERDGSGHIDGRNGGHGQTFSVQNRPTLTGVSESKGGKVRTLSPQNCPVVTGVSDVKGGQGQTLFDLPVTETPAERAAETPAETPAPNARARKEPQNPRIPEHPPNPPEGGHAPDLLVVEQTYRTERGRTRRRAVRVDLAELRRRLGIPTSEDQADWQRIRMLLNEAVGESTFAIWLEPLQMIAIDNSRALVVVAPTQTLNWVRERFGRLLATCAQNAGRELRLADEPERAAIGLDDGRSTTRARAISTNENEVS